MIEVENITVIETKSSYRNQRKLVSKIEKKQVTKMATNYLNRIQQHPNDRGFESGRV
jgi:hypothetical protein